MKKKLILFYVQQVTKSLSTQYHTWERFICVDIT